MTDKIDLDDLDVPEDSEETDPDEPDEGDWLRRDAGAPPDRDRSDDSRDADAPSVGARSAESGNPESGDAESDATDNGAETDTAAAADATSASDPADRVPHVPHDTKDKPIGIPTASGGGGGASAFGQGGRGGRDENAAASDDPDVRDDETGPHGGGVDDMTMAITYGAVRRLAEPRTVMADASRWADWIGIVGDVDAHVIHKFQRDNGVDADFFNGTGTGPGERLAEIGPRSMFYAERMVVVGVEGEDEDVAARADWEFVPLAEAAAKSDWELTE